MKENLLEMRVRGIAAPFPTSLCELTLIWVYRTQHLDEMFDAAARYARDAVKDFAAA